MRLEVNLQQRQQLQLKLAPQMIQAIEILQLPNLDLKDRIDLELAENEVLEIDDDEGPPPEVGAVETVAESGTAVAEAAAEGESDPDGDGPTDPEVPLDAAADADAGFAET